MKRTILYLFLTMSMLALVGCSHEKVDTSGYEAAQTHKENIINALSSDSLQYISGELTVIDSGAAEEPQLRVSARVILPQAIPTVADDICASTLALLEDDDYFSSYDISIQYYQESNAEGINDDSLVSWRTTNGNDGMFVDAENDIMKNYTIEELYDYYDGFGK